MERILNFFFILVLLGLVSFSTLLSVPAHGETSDKTIISRTAEVDGVKLQYLTTGHGPTLILLHGYAETSRMWRPLMPLLAERFTIIAPDLPGIGDSSIPADGLDMKNSAIRIHALARSGSFTGRAEG
jgi:alpha-beta hydrolase superfamily lysophospholipase